VAPLVHHGGLQAQGVCSGPCGGGAPPPEGGGSAGSEAAAPASGGEKAEARAVRQGRHRGRRQRRWQEYPEEEKAAGNGDQERSLPRFGQGESVLLHVWEERVRGKQASSSGRSSGPK